MRYLVTAAFALLALATESAFFYYFVRLTVDLFTLEGYIEFNKGAMYLFGVGLGAGLLALFMLYELMGKRISAGINRKATRAFYVTLGLIVLFPQLVDYAVRERLSGTNYLYCEEQSYRWLHVQTKVYGESAEACAQGAS